MTHLVPRMNELESDAWLRLIGLMELLPASLDAQLQQDAELTHFEFQVLSLLRFAPEQTLQSKELAAGTNATLPRLSHVVSRLEGRDYVHKLPCPTDRRATNVQLTDEGRRAVIRATGAHIDHVRRLVVDRLEPDELQSLASIAAKIGQALDPTDRLGKRLRGL